MAKSYTLADFDYDLPTALIAQAPAASRSGSRLLHVDGERLADRRFTDLPELLAPGDLLVMNDTRVINARIRGRKASGGHVEMLVERITGEASALVQMKASHPPAPGAEIALAADARAEVESLRAIYRPNVIELDSSFATRDAFVARVTSLDTTTEGVA